MKKLLGVLFACTVLAVFAMAASAEDEISAEAAPAEEYLAETEEDPLAGLWEEVEGLSREETEARFRQCLQDAGYTEVFEETHVTRPMSMDNETYDLAYSDLESADPETQKKILAARREIIFQYSWSADGGASISYNPTTMEFSITPQFEDLFPADWEPPVWSVEPDDSEAAPEEPETAEEAVNPPAEAAPEAVYGPEKPELPEDMRIQPPKAPAELETLEAESVNPQAEEALKAAYEPEKPAWSDDMGVQPRYGELTTNESTYVRKWASGSSDTAADHTHVGLRVSTYQNPGNGNFQITRRYGGA